MISVFTPVHPPGLKWLPALEESLFSQNYGDWEWIVLFNGGAESLHLTNVGGRVKAISDHNLKGIGALKRRACEEATGDILVEVDCDDLLREDALEKVAEAFSDEKTHFAYSDFAEFDTKKWEPHVYGSYWGWDSYPTSYHHHPLTAMRAFSPNAHVMRRIEFAPNHIRAWRHESYRKVGGHNPKLTVGDDHELVCRTYMAFGSEGFHHIPECIYYYRLHGKNTCKSEQNKKIQQQSAINYETYYERMCLRDAQERGLLCLDLGGGIDGRGAPYKTVDMQGEPDIKANLEGRWPFEDSSVGLVRASHIFEHLRDPIHTMNELHRVLVPGGIAFIEVPSTDGRGAWQDPTHISFWNQNSFWYYTRKTHTRYIPAFKGSFQDMHTRTLFPSKWWKDQNIPVVRSDLVALKPGVPRIPGAILN